MIRTTILVLFFFIVAPFSLMAKGKTLSPFDFGLSSAKNGCEIFYILQKTHETAVVNGDNVSYQGIKQLEIEIPADATTIPLPNKVDFCGVKLVVRNNSKSLYLFIRTNQIEEISIEKRMLQTLDFRDIPALREGFSLLIIEDQTPWVNNRKGFDYGAIRKDIVFVKQGRGCNRVIYPYSSKQSNPKTFYRKIDTVQKKYCNLIFERTADSKEKTFLIKCENQYNVELNNIKIKTPKSEIFGDFAITIRNCAKILFEDVVIDGTYSTKNKYGYGIMMNNVYKSVFVRLKGEGEWGVFGNNNVNNAVLIDSDINRFDIHCYGRDVYCYNTVFRTLFNQFSSFYGELVFDNCTFEKFIPVVFEYSYAAYSFFNLKLKDCLLNVDVKRPYLINAGTLPNSNNNIREELKAISWPNIEIDGLTLNLPDELDNWYLFKVTNKTVPVISGLKKIKIKGLVINTYKPLNFIMLSNREIRTAEKINVTIESSDFKYVRNREFMNDKIKDFLRLSKNKLIKVIRN